MNHYLRFLKKTILAFSLSLLVVTPSFADDVTDTVKEAMDFYKSGDMTNAVSSLKYATQLIQQKKGETLKTVLPKPLSGWKGDEAQSTAVAGDMLGGGLTAERVYHKGNSRININIIADSPLMQSVMMMMSNPMILASSGGKLQKIKGQKAAVKFRAADKGGEVQLVVVNRFLVTVAGSNVTEKDLVSYAKAIDYNKMKKIP